MPSTSSPRDSKADLALQALAEKAEEGAPLPELVRLIHRELGLSLLVYDRGGRTLALASRSSAEERALRAGGGQVLKETLRYGGERVGTVALLAGPQGLPAAWPLIRLAIAGELRNLERPGRGVRRAVQGLIAALYAAGGGDGEEVARRLADLNLDAGEELTVVLARVHLQGSPEAGWRDQLLAAFEQALRAGGTAAVCGVREEEGNELVGVVAGGQLPAERAAAAAARELAGLGRAVVGFSRPVSAAAELPRAAAEALLAANVAEGQEAGEPLSFERTGSYRLLLSAVRESPEELQRFYEETVAPLVAYDEQYETALVATLETFLECDGSVAAAAQRLYTHRHTVYYRLERIKELSGLDVSSSEGRERLSLGLKAMRVLGLGGRRPPSGP